MGASEPAMITLKEYWPHAEQATRDFFDGAYRVG